MPRLRTRRIEQHGLRYRVSWWVSGERHRRTFDSREAAAEFLDRLKAGYEEQEGSGSRLGGSLTVGDVVANWYRDHMRNLSSGTQRDYQGRIGRDVPRIAHLDANVLARNPRELRAFYGTLTPTNARPLHAILRQAFQDALDHGEISRNPCDVVKARRPQPAERLIPSPVEVEKILLAAEEEDRIWGLFINVTATLGTRRGETCALRWADIDFAACRVHVRRAMCKGVRGPKEIKPPKTGRERTLLVGREFFDQLLDFRPKDGWTRIDAPVGATHGIPTGRATASSA